jgi:hypothetical protein
MEEPLNFLESLLDVGIVVVMIVLVFPGSRWIFGRLKSGKESINIIRNSFLSLIVLVGTIAFVLTLPIDKNLKGQIISFLGIIISAAIALSSTTLLGDFSVTCKVHGFLKDSDKYYSSSSLLNGKVMDVLHENRVEIVSPSFMNQRQVSDRKFIPKGKIDEPTKEKQVNPEELIFDKAFKTEDLENRKKYLKEIEAKKNELNDVLKDLDGEKEKEKMILRLKRLDEIRDRIENDIKEQHDELNKEE